MPLGRHEIYVHLLIIVFLLKNCTKLNMIAMSLQPAALTDSRIYRFGAEDAGCGGELEAYVSIRCAGTLSEIKYCK